LLAAANFTDSGRLAGVEPYYSLSGEKIAYELLFEKRVDETGTADAPGTGTADAPGTGTANSWGTGSTNSPGTGSMDATAFGYATGLDPAGDLFSQLSADPEFIEDFNSASFSRKYVTVVISATFDRGPVLYWYNGLPQSAKMKKLVAEYLDEVVYGENIRAWLPLYFKPGFLFLAGRMDTGEMFLFSPDERIVSINDLSDIEYMEALPALSPDDRAFRKWADLLSGSVGMPGDRSKDESYSIPDIEDVRDIFYNRGIYWPETMYPYLYDEGRFGGCCHANSGLQLALYHDNHHCDNLVNEPDDAKSNRLDAMSVLVYEGYAPGQKQGPAFRDFANSKGYYFTYYYDYYPTIDDLKEELGANRPVQYLIFSSDEVVVGGYTYDHFAHSVLAAGYSETTTDVFTITLYWGWRSLPEIEFEFGSEFEEQFENQYMIKNYPPDSPNPDWIVINEVYADPSPGLFGDANKDGLRETYRDEFIELYNTGVMDMDVSGWSLGDDDGDPFVFPEGTYIPVDGMLTLFGGGNPTFVPGVVFAAGSYIGNGLTNTGDTVLLKDAQGATIDSFTYPYGDVRGDRDVSMILDPDGIGEWKNPTRWVDPFYSPGRLNRDDTVHPDITLNEILADPPSGIEGDANGDGVRHAYEDEFVEIISLETEGAADLSFWCITDDDPSLKTFRFPSGTKILPGEFAVVFGGGSPTGIPGKWFTSRGRISNGLANRSDRVMLTTQDFEVIASLRWPKNPVYGNRDRSMIRVPDGTGEWRLPMGEEPIFSPNVENADLQEEVFLAINEVLADPPPGIEGDANGDGQRSSSGDEFVEIYNYGDEEVDLWGYKIVDASGSFFSIPEGVIVPAGGFLTVFGSGTPTGIPGVVITTGGCIGNGLKNTGDTVYLIDRYDNTLDEIEWPGEGYEGGINVSMIRVPDITGDWENSLPPLPPYTPGVFNTD